MVRHNNVIPNQHFHKNWARRVKTWFAQPLQKKIRRDKRKEKAAKLAPRPSEALRPVVHCPTQKYNTKVKLGRGFTLDELKAAGINRKFAQTIGIAVDHRRTNKCEESLNTNVDRLKNYKAKLVVFPRRTGIFKKGDASAAEIANVQNNANVDVNKIPAQAPAVTYAAITEELKANKAYAALRQARTDVRLVGIRKKQADAAKEKKDKEEA